jgi:uncharacterized protein with PIN domain
MEALRQDRIIVTKQKNFPSGLKKLTVRICADEPHLQLKELVSALSLSIEEQNMFSRCVLCNAVLEAVKKEQVKGQVPERVYAAGVRFTRCPACKKLYWEGTHWLDIREVIGKL